MTGGRQRLLAPVAGLLVLLLGVEVGEVRAGALVVREATQAGREAVPVIHLNNGKASVDEYLKLFPEQLLASNKRVKPIDVRKIEHEDFIDYEIEFVELPNDEANPDEFISKKTVDSESSPRRAETNRIQDDSFSFDQSGLKINRAGEVNLVNFVDLFRRARTKQRSRQNIGADRSDIRRRRRIKIKKDPGARAREINSARNQIDTSEQSKREQNNFSHNHFFKTRARSKARNLIQLPETERKATILDRRTIPQHQQRFSGFRTRKRIPLKFGRSFRDEEDDKPSDQLIRLRNSEIITKLERSGHNERQVIKTRDKSRDDLDDKMSVKQPEDDPRHVTPDQEEKSRDDGGTFPILTTTELPHSGFIRHSTTSPNKPSSDSPDPGHNAVVDSAVMNKGSESLELIRKVNLSLPPPTPSISAATTTAKTTTSQQDDVDLVKSASSEALSNERAGESSLTPTIAPLRITTTTSTTSTTAETLSTTPVMMYPEVFTQLPLNIKTYQGHPVPLSLLSVFGSQPRSSRLQVASNSLGPRIEVSWSQSQSEAISRPEVVSVFSQPLTEATTFSSPSLIITNIPSSSTQRSAGLFDTNTTSAEDGTDVTDYPHNLYKNEQLFTEQSAATRASSSTKSTTISLVTTTPGGMTEDVTETTKADSDVTRQRDTALKTLRQNESKSQEVTTVMPGGVGSITGDNQMMTTPIPQDLQLSESITSVYLHNSSSVPAVSNNIETSEPKKDPNSISLVPFSKLTHHIRDSSSSTSAPVTSESVFTVTPVSTEASSTMMTYDDLRTSTVTLDTTEMTTMMDIYSGQYHEVNPGQYHEINPGQYHEANPGQYHEVNPGQYGEEEPGRYYKGHEGKYQNLESAYPGDYEVNEVKVDFDNRDEHKIYNVQAKAGDFIIGEVGKIDVNNGQTVEGVRYTALEGEVDPLKIAEILNRYFGTRTS